MSLPDNENTTVYTIDKYGKDYFAACDYCHGEILKIALLRRYKNCPFCGRKIVKTVNAWERGQRKPTVTERAAPCFWISDDYGGICANPECPIRAQICPLKDIPGVCRYEERNC